MLRVSDERAIWLSRFVLPHEPSLRAWLNRRRVPGLEVDDIVQETYSRLIAMDTVADIRNVRGYLYQVAHSVLLLHIRRAKIIPIEIMGDMDAVDIASAEASPEDFLLGRDELSGLFSVISGLPQKIKDVFLMRRVDGFSQRETAQKLGLSESTVEKHMSRGILLVLNHLSDSGIDSARASKAWGDKLRKDRSDRGVRKQNQRD
ncbi:sigma-70 family RNA polymerase sigma factor [Asticcacaulis sp. BYS171W]|uniref:Sigma-70 family RNA polymerase sigma factor n=1 Tax=Asticcacaulis aquaticus TaxID=2984212 RepID=A0ABT5I0I3_9CAUL|nr:sigma-70 family RNA polymerase sigma factor [Asticcacaulis aquaticus]MDC7685191.1 sigma-70 family RNA polymerase sigma factor [Asticcacaulis aquaticus]